MFFQIQFFFTATFLIIENNRCKKINLRFGLNLILPFLKSLAYMEKF